MATTNDNGFVGQAGIIAFFDRGVECITVHMRDGQSVQFSVRNDARTDARRATPSAFKFSHTIATKGRHLKSYLIGSMLV